MDETAIVAVDTVDITRCSVGFRIDCNTVDREKDRFVPDALDLTNHQKIPVALFTHDRQIPIGVCENAGVYTIKSLNGIVEGAIYFNQADYTAMSIFDLAYNRILRGVSLGFLPWSDVPNEFGGVDYTKAELVEVSLCVLPENPDGLVTWVQKTFKDRKPLELDDRVLYHLHKHLPAEKVSMLLTTKAAKADDKKPVDDKKPDDKKPDDATGDEVETTAGMKALQAVHEMELALAMKMDELGKGQELAEVKEFLANRKSLYMDSAAEVCELHKTLYPDAEELKADEGAEHEVPVEEVKNLKKLEREFKVFLVEHKALQSELNSLKANRRKDRR